MNIRNFAFASLLCTACIFTLFVSCTPKEEQEIVVTSVSLDQTSLSLVEGQSSLLTATVSPSNATDKTVYWNSSAVDIASVDASGMVTAVKAGTADITVTTRDGGKKATCRVTVTARIISVVSVTVSPASLSLVEGESETLTLEIKPDNATNKEVEWISADTEVATVDGNGTVTAVKPGETNIIVTTKDGGKRSMCRVRVNTKVIPVTGVTVSPETLSLEEGEKATLTETIIPENATDKGISWTSSDTEVATVDGQGEVRAIKPGTADITVTTRNGGKTATCKLTVTAKYIPATNVLLNKQVTTLFEGESETLVATVYPENATNKEVEWKSSNPSVASVDQNGKVTAIKTGASEIRVTSKDGGHYSICVVSVYKRRNYKFRVSINGGEFADAKSSYTYTLLPPDAYSGVQRFLFYVCEDNNVTSVQDSDRSHYDISIVSQNPAGTVTTLITGQEAYGGDPKYYTPWVYPKLAGNAKVKLSYDDGAGNAISKEISFTIEAESAKSISLGCNEFALGVGNTRKMKATFTPADASFQDVSWSSSNTSVAKVSSSGVVTAVAKGEAQIKAVNSEGVQGTAKVVVWEQPQAVDLGLSVLWADRNLGAASSSFHPVPDYCFFAWSETAPEKLDGKDSYYDHRLTYWDDNKGYSKYCVLSSDGIVDNKTRLDPEDDAARVILGNGWRMPTAAEVQELLKLTATKVVGNSTNYTPSIINGVRFTGSNGKYITLPMWAAYSSNSSLVGMKGFYWTADLLGGTGTDADMPRSIYLECKGTGGNDIVYTTSSGRRNSGYCIRPVKDK